MDRYRLLGLALDSCCQTLHCSANLCERLVIHAPKGFHCQRLIECIDFVDTHCTGSIECSLTQALRCKRKTIGIGCWCRCHCYYNHIRGGLLVSVIGDNDDGASLMAGQIGERNRDQQNVALFRHRSIPHRPVGYPKRRCCLWTQPEGQRTNLLIGPLE